MQLTESQIAFEVETSSWGLDYERNEYGTYIDFQTGVVFGSFDLGWNAAVENMRKNYQNIV